MELLKRPLWFYVKMGWRPFTVGILFLIVTNIFDGLGPYVLKWALDAVVDWKGMSELGRSVALYSAVMLGLAMSRFGWRVYYGRYHTEAAEDLRFRIFDHFLKLTPQFFRKTQIGELISLISSDVNTFRQAIGNGLLILFDAFFMSLVILPMMASMQPTWTWKTLIILPAIPFFAWYIHKWVHRNYRIYQDELAKLSGFSQEIVTGIRQIKGFAQEDQTLKRYNSFNSRLEAAGNRAAFVDGLFIPVMDFGVAVGSVILMFIAIDDIYAGAVTIGTFVAFQRYIDKMVWPVSALGFGISNFQRGRASFDRIREVLVQQPEIHDSGTEVLSDFEALEVKDLCFQYSDGHTPVLSNISFSVKAGEKIGIVGQVGSGKTTLSLLLTRLLKPNSGSININNKPIENYTLESLRSCIRLIPQDVFLFSDTVKNNILIGAEVGTENDSWDNRVVTSITSLVQMNHEIEELPQAIESQLGERGVNLSGGQKQRLTLARGLASHSPLVIIDDALSAVDVKTERAINEALAIHAPNQARIIITHRLANLESCHRIIVFKDGMIEAAGTFQDLELSSPSFQQLVMLQKEAPSEHIK